jgi:hypothetical protein
MRANLVRNQEITIVQPHFRACIGIQNNLDLHKRFFT